MKLNTPLLITWLSLPLLGAMSTTKICHKGVTKTVNANRTNLWKKVGATVGPCGSKKLNGDNFQVFPDLNDHRLMSAQVAGKSVATMYGEKNLQGQVKSFTSMSLERGKNELYNFDLDDVSRMRRARSPNAQFQMVFNWLGKNTVVQYENKGRGYQSLVDVGSLRRLEEDDEAVETADDEEVDLDDENLFNELAALDQDDEAHYLRSVHDSRQLAPDSSSRPITVKLQICGDNFNEAEVKLNYVLRDDKGNKRDGFVMCERTDGNDGKYDCNVPVRWTKSQNVQSTCRKTIKAIAPGCEDFIDAMKLDSKSARAQFCRDLAKELSSDEKDAVIPACKDTLEAAYDSCSVLQTKSGSGSVDLDKEVCQKSLDQPSSFTAKRWALTPEILSPFQWQQTLPTKNEAIPTTRQETTFDTFDLSDKPSIDHVELDPPNPTRLQNYKFKAFVRCVNKNDNKIFLTVKGSDGFKRSEKCGGLPNQSKGSPFECEMQVPGGRKDVSDTLTVDVQPGPTKSYEVTF